MSVYRFHKSLLLLNGIPVYGFPNIEDAIVYTPEGQNHGTLSVKLLQSSKYNTVLSVLVKTRALVRTFSIAIKPDGTDDFILFANGMFGARIVEGVGGNLTAISSNNAPIMPRSYSMGTRIGINEWLITCVGVNDMILGDL